MDAAPAFLTRRCAQLEVTASLLRGIAPLLSRNDPGVVSAVLSVMSAFVHSCTRLTAEESNR